MMATEKRLIDANDVKKTMYDRYDHAFIQSHTRPNIAWWEGYAAGVNWARNTLNDAPTVDAVEVVQGMWLWYSEDIYTCSNCYEKVHVKEVMGRPDYHYCPNCGAKMDGGVFNGSAESDYAPGTGV